MENELSCPLSCLYLHLLFCAPFFKIKNVPLVASACEVKLKAEVVRCAFDVHVHVTYVRMFDVYGGHETEGKKVHLCYIQKIPPMWYFLLLVLKIFPLLL